MISSGTRSVLGVVASLTLFALLYIGVLTMPSIAMLFGAGLVTVFLWAAVRTVLHYRPPLEVWLAIGVLYAVAWFIAKMFRWV